MGLTDHQHTTSSDGSRLDKLVSLMRRFYPLVFFGLPLWMFWHSIKRTDEFLTMNGPGYYEIYGKPQSWIVNNRPIDLSDVQWRHFRKSLPMLLVAAIVFVLLRRGIERVFGRRTRTPSIVFYVVSSFIFLFALFGPRAIFPLFSFFICWFVVRRYKAAKLNPLITWLFCIFVLVTSDIYRGYKISWLVPFASVETTRWLDGFKGMIDWNTYFNVLMCRLISHNMDLYYHYQAQQGQNDYEMDEKTVDQKRHELVQSLASGELHITQNRPEQRHRYEQYTLLDKDFNLLHAFIYAFYVPLLLAGPIVPFKSFVSYLYHPQKEYSTKRLLFHCLLVPIYACVYEFLLTMCYWNMFTLQRFWKPDSVWSSGWRLAPFLGWEATIMGTITLFSTFMKFVIIWKLFRFWAIADGVNPVENLNRCIVHCPTVSSFWRAWHRSLYFWINLYIYRPLGGNKHKLRNSIIIFFFMAIWHDLWLSWVAWAFFNLSLLLVEVGVTKLFQHEKLAWVKKLPFYRLLLVEALTFNLMILQAANLSIMYSFEDTLRYLWMCLFGNGAYLSYLVVPTAVAVLVDAQMIRREKEEERTGEKSAY